MLGGSCNPCCGGLLCSDQRDRATITISGLPVSCTSERLDNRMLADDNCSYPLFRITSASDKSKCRYATVWHSKWNSWGFWVPYDANKLILDVRQNTLTLYSEFLVVQFVPADGKTFLEFPFSGTLTAASVSDALSQCAEGAFDNVYVEINDDEPSYTPFVCPGINVVAPNETCSCVAGVDTLSIYSESTQGNIKTVEIKEPIYACAPCDGTHYSTSTTTTVFKTPCTSDEVEGCIESVSHTSSWPELSLDVEFQGPDIGGYSLSQLSGAYSLKWTENAHIGNADFLGLAFGEWTSTGTQNGFDVGVSGGGFLFGSSYGSNPQQGWRTDYRMNAQVPYGNCLGMTIVVAPVKATWNIDRSAKTIAHSMCGAGDVAYQVKLAVFRGINIGSDYKYWTWELSSYANVACMARDCTKVPNVSLSSTETVYVPLSGQWWNTRGRIGTVSVSVSG